MFISLATGVGIENLSSNARILQGFEVNQNELVIQLPIYQTKLTTFWYGFPLANVWGGRHSSVVSFAPTILRPQVRIPSTPSMLFSICIEIVIGKE